MRKRILCITMTIAMLLTSACGKDLGYAKKVRDMDYTVVALEDLPEDLRKAVEEKKEQGCKLTYAKGNDLYIVMGYGKKEMSGYSIQVKNLYLTKNAIYFETELLGPEGDEVITQSASYPSIAIKTEFLDYSVIFD